MKTDEELMRSYQEGDSTAFDELYRRYSPRVYGYLGRRLGASAIVDDVFQAAFLKLHHSRDRYDPSLPFAPWLFTVCRSVVVDHFRRVHAQGPLGELGAEGDAALLAVSLPTGGVAQEPAATVDLVGLNPVQRQALEMRYLQDASFQEIARKLETTPGNARQILSRAIRRLRGRAKGGTDE